MEKTEFGKKIKLKYSRAIIKYSDRPWYYTHGKNTM